MEFDYTVTTTKDFDTAADAVVKEIGNAGMRVLYIHDVQAALAEKGFTREPFKIIEFCNAKYAVVILHRVHLTLINPAKQKGASQRPCIY